MSGEVTIEYIDKDESWRIFDAAAQRHLGISGAEFSSSWDQGVYADRDEVAIMRVAMLRPSGR
jgi:hypothetical protein